MLRQADWRRGFPLVCAEHGPGSPAPTHAGASMHAALGPGQRPARHRACSGGDALASQGRTNAWPQNSCGGRAARHTRRRPGCACGAGVAERGWPARSRCTLPAMAPAPQRCRDAGPRIAHDSAAAVETSRNSRNNLHVVAPLACQHDTLIRPYTRPSEKALVTNRSLISDNNDSGPECRPFCSGEHLDVARTHQFGECSRAAK